MPDSLRGVQRNPAHYVRLWLCFPAKERALVRSSSLSTCAAVPSLSFIVNLGNGTFSLGASAFQISRHLKKRPTPEPLSRRCQRVSNDSQSGRLQLLFHQATSISTLRLDGPAHARLPTDHVIGQVPQSAFQALHRFIRHMTHPQRRAEHLSAVEEIAFQLTTIY